MCSTRCGCTRWRSYPYCSWISPPSPTCTSAGWARKVPPTCSRSPWTSCARRHRGATAPTGPGPPTAAPPRRCSVTWSCARRWPRNRPGRRSGRSRRNWRCSARTASFTCSGLTTPSRGSVPPCSGCRTGCWTRGAPSACRAGPQWSATGRQAGKPGDAAMGWLVAAAVALAVLAGLCASAEIALLRTARTGGRDRARDGPNGHSPQLQAVLAEPRRHLSVLLAVRVGAETAAVVLTTAALVQWLGTGWHTYLIALAGMAALLYLVAGAWPVTLGRQYDRQLAGAAASVLVPLVRALGPLPRLLVATANVLTPGRSGRDGSGESEEELRGLVDLLEEHQVIEPGERAMIHSVFEFGDTIVREVMVPRTDIVFAERDKNVRQVLSLALRSGFSRIPVVGENKDDVIGIAYLKDLVARSREHPEAETVEKVESVMRPATFVPESKPAYVLLREMQARQIHLAIVIDEYGGTAGLVT